MAPQEVAGLQALAKAHGGSLTTNPDTGLPEAGFLSNILPMIAGLALAPMTAGTSLAFLGATPLASALTVGGATGLATGSLKKGLMAGLGAYGGAGLGGALTGAGTSQVGAVSNALGANGATGVGSQAAMLAEQNAAGGFGQAGLESLGQSAAVAQGATPAVQSAGQSMLAGAQGLGTEAGRKAFVQQMGGNKSLMRTGLAAAAPLLLGGSDQNTAAPAGDSKMPQRLQYNAGAATTTPMPDVPGYDNLGKDFGRQQNYFPNAGYQNISDEEAKRLRGYAYGGPVQEMSDQAEAQTLMANHGQMFADGGLTALARGGASHLGDYSDGGRMLRGPGDGVSDSIPATIGGKRPARLADGEFVVPARIVSEIGNGSSEAGARKLYAMMDRVQKARKKSIGKNRVAVNSRADKLLPA
jgi:hypothetical protein